MKIERVHFENLNSLYGEWDIDLTHPDFVQNGLFVISGPTGSGKTTILDAICLALFGATPRLGKISKEPNELMSRQTGYCFAEVIFVVNAKRYRSFWYQQKAYKNSDGGLQPPKHELGEVHADNTVSPIETQTTKVVSRILEITGLNFNQFTQSMMLAQGRFADFLNADDNDRARILEQLASTAKYRKISERTYYRAKDEEKLLESLTSEKGNLEILSAEQVAAHKKDIATLRENEKKYNKELETMRQKIAWIEHVASLENELADIRSGLEQWVIDNRNFAAKDAQLALAERAQRLAGEYASLNVQRKQYREGRNNLTKRKANLPELQDRVRQKRNALNAAQAALTAFSEEKARAEAIMAEKRKLDAQIEEQTKAVADAAHNCNEQQKRVEQEDKEREKTFKSYSAKSKEQEQADAYWREHRKDEWLASGFSGIEEKLNRLAELQDQHRQLEAKRQHCLDGVSQADTALAEALARMHMGEETAADAEKEVQDAETKLNDILKDRSLEEYRGELTQLEAAWAKQLAIENFAAARNNLEKGAPCPLCGSTEHPYLSDHVPSLDPLKAKRDTLIGIINAAERERDRLLEIATKAGAARETCTRAEGAVESATKDKERASKDAEEAQNLLAETWTKVEGLRQGIFETCTDLKGDASAFANIPKLVQSLKTRRDKWQEANDKRQNLLAELEQIRNRLDQHDGLLREMRGTFKDLTKTLVSKKEILNTSRDERRQLGDLSPDEDAQRLKEAENRLSTTEKREFDAFHEAERAFGDEQSALATLEQTVREQAETLQQLEASFAQALATQTFADEAAFCQAAMPDEEMALLQKEKEALENRKTDLDSRQQDRSDKLEKERSRRLTQDSKESLVDSVNAMQDTIGKQLEKIGRLNKILEDNDRKAESATMLQQKIDTQCKVCDRWKKLWDLIGSADGSKFVRFAQGLTFRNLVANANRELAKMFPRYHLHVPPEGLFTLHIIDHDQADEQRPIANLSGGETFIVSLALALGLAQMASQKMRVDSLFLDEGFGALDENTLSTVLDALAGLHQNGKLIGVISHVQDLTERIPAKIEITKLHGGRSHISGPGCKQLY